MQVMHTDAPEPTVYCPLAQAAQVFDPAVAAILPASHDKHAVELEESEN